MRKADTVTLTLGGRLAVADGEGEAVRVGVQLGVGVGLTEIDFDVDADTDDDTVADLETVELTEGEAVGERAPLGLCVGDGDSDEEELSEAVPVPVVDADIVTDTLTDGEEVSDREAVVDCDTLGDALVLAETDSDGVTDSETLVEGDDDADSARETLHEGDGEGLQLAVAPKVAHGDKLCDTVTVAEVDSELDLEPVVVPVAEVLAAAGVGEALLGCASTHSKATAYRVVMRMRILATPRQVLHAVVAARERPMNRPQPKACLIILQSDQTVLSNCAH